MATTLHDGDGGVKLEEMRALHSSSQLWFPCKHPGIRGSFLRVFLVSRVEKHPEPNDANIREMTSVLERSALFWL